MDSNSSNYSNHKKASIANLIDNSDEALVSSEGHSHVALGTPSYGYVNGARLDNILNQNQHALSLPTPLQLPPLVSSGAPLGPPLGYFTLPTPTLNTYNQQLVVPAQIITDPSIAPIKSDSTDDADVGDSPDGKKKRGRPRIHPEKEKRSPESKKEKKNPEDKEKKKRNPEDQKEKRTVRGRPRSETSKRALKEAAKKLKLMGNDASPEAAKSLENFENNINVTFSELHDNDPTSSPIVAIEPQLNAQLEPQSSIPDPSATLDISQVDSKLSNDTSKPILEAVDASKPKSKVKSAATSQIDSLITNSKSQESVDLSKIKRKLSETGTSTETKQKPKKVKKEEVKESTKTSATDSESILQQLPKKSASSTATPSISNVGSPSVKQDDIIYSTKKKRTDGSRRKQPSSGLNGYSQAADYDEEGEAYCICRRGDNGEWMIGCDSCDDWFHGSCVNMTEKGSVILIKYVCPRCTEAGKAVSIFKRKCRLPECNLPVQYEAHVEGETDVTPKSKYCSPEHGMEFFKQLVDKIPSQQNLDPHIITAPQLVTLMNKCKTFKAFHKLGTAFPAARNLPSEADIEKAFSATDLEMVSELQRQIDLLDDKIRYNGYRIQFVQQCKERAKRISEEMIQEEEGKNGGEGEEADAAEATESKPTKSTKSKKKKKQQKVKKDLCGYNSKLTLEDEKWQQFMTTEAGQKVINQRNAQEEARQNREFTCLTDKRKCSRHNGWQTLVLGSATDMERSYRVEQDRLRNQLSELYYKQQVQMMIESTNTDENKIITCD